jgi:hypothetical protein
MDLNMALIRCQQACLCMIAVTQTDGLRVGLTATSCDDKRQSFNKFDCLRGTFTTQTDQFAFETPT